MIKVFMVVRWPVGGIRTFINYVYSNWTNPELEIHFLVPNLAEVDALKKQLSGVNCIWHLTESEDPSFKEFMFSAFNILRKNKFNLIHAHGFTSAFSVALKLPFSRVGSIFTSHDVLNQSQFSGVLGAIKKRIFAFFLNRFDCIHSVSHEAEHNLLKTLPAVSTRKSQVILNGVNTEHFYAAQAVALKEKLGVANNVRLIGFFGRFMSQKGFKYLVDAVEMLEEEYPGRYKVVTFGEGCFIREEKAVLESRGLLSLFFFHDFVSDTAPYIKACDIVAMPSLWEACPLVPMEVLAAGVPLVASSCIGLGEVCQNTPAVMAAPANAEQLYQALHGITESTESVFSQFAPIAKDRFNIKVTVASLQTLYCNLTK